MSFWWWAAAFGVCAAAFVAFPLLRSRRVADADSQSGADRSAMARALYRDRLAELDGEVAVGQLAPEARELMAAEMGAALLADYPVEDRATSLTNAPAPMLALGVVLLLVTASVGIYLQVGEPGASGIAGAEEVLSLDPRTQASELQQWRTRLQSRVASKPEDAQSWYLLGHVHLQLQGYPQAAEAFAMAHAAMGDDPSIDIYWLQARYLAAKGVIDDTTRGIAERLLSSRPNHPLVLEMFAIDAYRRGEFRQAVDNLNRALSGPLSPEQRVMLTASLDQARGHLGDLVPSLDLQVTTVSQPPRGASLFVIARPPGGGMPYAVVRRPDAVFPVSVRLDDAVAMNPLRPLSTADEIQIVVRLSLSGAARAQPGDWQWSSEPLKVAEFESPVGFEVELAPPPLAAVPANP
jgi:cytochrome c-type biogenesis protein CcmH